MNPDLEEMMRSTLPQPQKLKQIILVAGGGGGGGSHNLCKALYLSGEDIKAFTYIP